MAKRPRPPEQSPPVFWVVMNCAGGPSLANSSHRRITDAHRSPASQPSPLDKQNRAVMLREGKRGGGMSRQPMGLKLLRIISIIICTNVLALLGKNFIIKVTTLLSFYNDVSKLPWTRGKNSIDWHSTLRWRRTTVRPFRIYSRSTLPAARSPGRWPYRSSRNKSTTICL